MTAAVSPEPEFVMRIAVLAETDKAEPRVAATPETVKKFVGLGADVAFEAGAGAAACSGAAAGVSFPPLQSTSHTS